MIMECGSPLLEALGWVALGMAAGLVTLILGFAIAGVIVLVRTALKLNVKSKKGRKR